MNTFDFGEDSKSISTLLIDLFEIGAVYRQEGKLVYSLSYRFDRAQSVKLIKDRLKMAGYRFSLSEQEDVLVLYIDPQRRFKIPRINVVLFVLTLFSIYFVPVLLKNLNLAMYHMANQRVPPPDGFLGEVSLTLSVIPLAFSAAMSDLANGVGIEFTLALISILFVHEMGHFIASRRRNIITSWPYFIPAPNIIGTFGAIIKSKSPFWNRRDLIEVGAAGPIAGWVVAVGWLLWGLTQSTILPADAFSPKDMLFSLEGESILMRAATLTLVGPAPEGLYYRLTEAAFAGWVGLLVTAINLLPIGQLDGGHILYGLIRKSQFILARLAMVGLFVLGFHSMMWWLFAGFGLIFGVKHPPTMDDNRKPAPVATALGIVSLLILVLSFTPVPFH
ncbi:MAG: site-2 protease family protein [Candidatus Zixiibacteriota bacterium]